MLKNTLQKLGSLSVVASVSVALVGCENLPGSSREQGAAIGGVGGAVAGAAIGGSEHRLLGALLGGALGAGGGYVVGAQAEKVNRRDTSGARAAVERAQTQPATAAEARAATSADINGDGFVTMDEVVAMERADFTNEEMIERLRTTGQIFELTQQQRQFLLDNGVDAQVVNQMEEINRETRDRLLSEMPAGQERISRPADTQF